MSAGWIIILASGGLVVCLVFWGGARWLARSWELLDDDQLSEKFAGDHDHPHAAWLRVLGWFGRGPRQLTYRRDERGRFRRIRR